MSPGRVDLELVGQGSLGGAYRLRHAIVRVQSSGQILFFDSEDAEPAGTLSAVVSPGEYSTFLQDGWSLERVADGTVVAATLITPNPGSFSVASGQLARLALQFRVAS